MTPRRKLLILPRSVAAALAEEVDVGDDLAAVAGAQGADVGDQPAVADDHLDLAADLAGHGDRRVLVRLEAAAGAAASMRICEPEPAISTHLADRRERVRLAPGGAAAAALVGEAADFVEELHAGSADRSLLAHSTFRIRDAQALARSG